MGQANEFWDNVDRSGGPDACWPWTGSLHQQGYGRVSVFGKRLRAHRVAFLLAYGYMPANVLHECDNPPCCNPECLRDGSHADNMDDMAAKGRRRSWALTDKQRTTVRKRAAAGTPLRELAEEYGVTYQAIYDLTKKKEKK